MKIFACRGIDSQPGSSQKNWWRAWMWKDVEVLQWAGTVRKQPENFDEGSRVYRTS
jgi:hypothetical protein